MFDLKAVKSEEFNYFLSILKKHDSDIEQTINELNTIHHYNLESIDDFIEKFYDIKQFITFKCLNDAHKYYESEMNAVDETYRERFTEVSE